MVNGRQHRLPLYGEGAWRWPRGLRKALAAGSVERFGMVLLYVVSRKGKGKGGHVEGVRAHTISSTNQWPGLGVAGEMLIPLTVFCRNSLLVYEYGLEPTCCTWGIQKVEKRTGSRGKRLLNRGERFRKVL